MVRGPAAVIEPGRLHAVHGGRDHAVIVLVEPTSRAGRQLRHRRSPTELGPGHPVGVVTSGLSPGRWAHVNEAVHRTLALGGAAVDPAVPRWWHRPDVADALLGSPTRVDDHETDASRIATTLGVSLDELGQSFERDLGVSVRVAMRWRRLVVALEHLADGGSVAAAAQLGRYEHTGQFERDFVNLFGTSANLSGPPRSWFQ